jgi:hypothetical protein
MGGASSINWRIRLYISAINPAFLLVRGGDEAQKWDMTGMLCLRATKM